jgi:hypothetical protein
MSLCSNGQKATIKWQYPGEELVQILGADGYSVGYEQGQCNTSYIVKGKSAVNGLTYCGASWQTDPTPVNSWTINTSGRVKGLKRITGINSTTQPQPKYNTTSFGTCGSAIPGATTRAWYSYLDWEGQTNITQGGLIYFNEVWVSNFDSQVVGKEVVKIDSIKRSDGLPDQCGNCVLKILKNNLVVHARAEPMCPTVTYTCGDQCPPGTCQCDCGSEVCCYDTATGKAVKSFRK